MKGNRHSQNLSMKHWSTLAIKRLMLNSFLPHMIALKSYGDNYRTRVCFLSWTDSNVNCATMRAWMQPISPTIPARPLQTTDRASTRMHPDFCETSHRVYL